MFLVWYHFKFVKILCFVGINTLLEQASCHSNSVDSILEVIHTGFPLIQSSSHLMIMPASLRKIELFFLGILMIQCNMFYNVFIVPCYTSIVDFVIHYYLVLSLIYIANILQENPNVKYSWSISTLPLYPRSLS